MSSQGCTVCLIAGTVLFGDFIITYQKWPFSVEGSSSVRDYGIKSGYTHSLNLNPHLTLWWTNIAMENGHRNSGFSHIFPLNMVDLFHGKMLVHQRVSGLDRRNRTSFLDFVSKTLRHPLPAAYRASASPIEPGPAVSGHDTSTHPTFILLVLSIGNFREWPLITMNNH